MTDHERINRLTFVVTVLSFAVTRPAVPGGAAMKIHYFTQTEADVDDIQLRMAKMQGYVPRGCLLGGVVVMSEVNEGRNPCWGCEGPRERCGGKPKK